MFKKLSFLLAVLIIAVNLLTACQSNNNASDVSATDLVTVLNKKSSVLTAKAGWLHVVEKVVYDVDKENLGVLPNETVIPLTYLTDTWYHINNNSQVFEYVQRQTTMNGDIVQVSVFMNRVIVNLMTNYVLQMTPYNLGALDYRFANEMADYTNRTGKQATVKLDTVDGHKAAIITIEEKLDQPVTSDNYQEPVYSIRSVACYDTDSGLLFRLERIRIFKDGSERTFYKTQITVEQGGTPPQEILDYLKGIN